ncbi:uncharacterized protein Z519_03030 [Cladophialophora bantiana CBS 173.52]|uniref:BZIP domain-containing protein n=1 Tax=Cladophialophora bantiana (strain ATCC 10958 / CBS 173.52 / CDC B-1940 / NIH 8579) TaxID=1442370 RepID=A0A0D2IGU9_CLAB1|nr:uncharacterized protein Z519_03030 [Cladophialophora bantiana CBS 173.52]KIW95964.1 hypothetical protein Z519_03030 [Cladophialophora bantiana CBS 173.52]
MPKTAGNESGTSIPDNRRDKKRATDRVAQQAHRKRQKLQLEELRAEVEFLKTTHTSKQVQILLQENEALRRELESLRSFASSVESLVLARNSCDNSREGSIRWVRASPSSLSPTKSTIIPAKPDSCATNDTHHDDIRNEQAIDDEFCVSVDLVGDSPSSNSAKVTTQVASRSAGSTQDLHNLGFASAPYMNPYSMRASATEDVRGFGPSTWDLPADILFGDYSSQLQNYPAGNPSGSVPSGVQSQECVPFANDNESSELAVATQPGIYETDRFVPETALPYSFDNIHEEVHMLGRAPIASDAGVSHSNCKQDKRAQTIQSCSPNPPLPQDAPLYNMLMGVKEDLFNASSVPRNAVSEHLSNLLATGLKRIMRTWLRCRRDVTSAGVFYMMHLALQWHVLQTAEALQKLPVWYRPTAMQKGVPHPIIIDFIAWPRLRDEFIAFWQMHPQRLHEVAFAIGTCLELDFQPPNVADNRKRETFGEAVRNMRRWRLKALFFETYPQWEKAYLESLAAYC